MSLAPKILEFRNRSCLSKDTEVTMHDLDRLNLVAQHGFQARHPALTLGRRSS